MKRSSLVDCSGPIAPSVPPLPVFSIQLSLGAIHSMLVEPIRIMPPEIPHAK